MELDPLELIRRLCTQIPVPRQHLVRCYGWYAWCAAGAGRDGRSTPGPEHMPGASMMVQRTAPHHLMRVMRRVRMDSSVPRR